MWKLFFLKSKTFLKNIFFYHMFAPSFLLLLANRIYLVTD